MTDEKGKSTAGRAEGEDDGVIAPAGLDAARANLQLSDKVTHS